MLSASAFQLPSPGPAAWSPGHLGPGKAVPRSAPARAPGNPGIGRLGPACVALEDPQGRLLPPLGWAPGWAGSWATYGIEGDEVGKRWR